MLHQPASPLTLPKTIGDLVAWFDTRARACGLSAREAASVTTAVVARMLRDTDAQTRRRVIGNAT